MQGKYALLLLHLKLKIYSVSLNIFKGLSVFKFSIESLELTLKTIPRARKVIQIDVPQVLIKGRG